MKSKKQNDQSGFTLMEVVAVLSLVGVVTVVIANSFLQTAYTQKQLSGRLTAAILAENKLVEIASGEERNSYGNYPDLYGRKYSWSSETETKDNGLTEIVLTVKWSNPNGTQFKKVFKKTILEQ